MTERARKRLQGEEIRDEEEGDQARKVRVGPDGKPWRQRNRRGSDDIKRDQLVEEFLHENKRTFFTWFEPLRSPQRHNDTNSF